MKLFASVCENLSNESGSIKKVEIISEALLNIKTDKELALFCLYLTGLLYPSSVQKTINVGKALIRDAVVKLLNISVEEWNKAYREFGETGETIQNLLENYKQVEGKKDSGDLISEEEQIIYNPKGDFELNKFEEYVDKLTTTSGSLAKVKIIAELLSQLKPIEAKYVCKLLLQNLRIGVQEATVESAIAKAFEVEKKQVSHLNFYLGDIGEVAIRSKEKNFSDVVFRLFHPIRAMLASAEVEIDEIFKRMNGSVWAEFKYDGIRAHVHKLGGRVEIFTRDQKRITEQFPEVVKFFLEMEPDNFLIDGEIVPFSGGKIHPFAYIQKRLGRKDLLQEEVDANPAAFIAYDFLFFNDEVLFEKPLTERRELLEKTFGPFKTMFSTKKIVLNENEFLDFFKQSKAEGREGLMIKNPESKYESGKRGIHWLKYKQTLDPLDVVILFAHWGEGKNAKYLSSFTFGVWDENHKEIIPVGRVASGMNEEELKYFTEYLPKIAIEEIESGYKVEPTQILEVGFENIQKSERYSSGYAVRFPRVLRLRTGDKPVEEISTIKDVIRGFELLGQ
jgi:DNA ligase-1